MSTQSGNVSRTRPQKYQNKSKFKNDLHDKSHVIKKINNIEVANVCIRCKKIIEWKINYKKYKQPKNPSTCTKCHQKNVKFAYHTLCTDCATKSKLCPKCGKEKELVEAEIGFNPEEILKKPEIKSLLMQLPERRRRAVYRLMDKAEENDLCSEEKILQKLESMQLNCGKTDLSLDDLSDFDLSNDDDDSS